jgi:TRAP-type transport system periplasmic protein
MRALQNPPAMLRHLSIVRSSMCQVALVGLMLASPAGTAAEASEPEPRKLSTAVGPAFALGKAGDRWARLVTERSNGRIPVRFFPGAVLAQNDPAREFIALRDGAADLAVGSTLYWSSQVVALDVISLPWLAPEAKDLAAIVASPVAQQLVAAVERAGAVPLAFAVLGHRAVSMIGAAPRSPADFAGMRIRVVSRPMLDDLFVSLGALPRAMSALDAQAAFRAGTLDAQEGTLATIAAARLDTFGVGQVMLLGAVAECAVFAANKATWIGWTDDERSIVLAAARETAGELPALVRAEEDAAQAALERRGVFVTRLTPSGRATFASAARGVYDKWAAAVGEELVRAAEHAVKGNAR